MDAHALLTSQGWRGTGHSMHPTSDTNGLSRPLLVSQKDNNYGVGRKQHKTSDMWWMNAFDRSLKGLETDGGKLVQTVTSGGLDMVVKGGARWVGSGSGGLYGSFVKGDSLGGTITPEKSGAEMVERKRRRDGETKEDRRARKAAKRSAKLLESTSGETTEIEAKAETKEERKARRAAKKISKEEEPAVEGEPEPVEVDEFPLKVETKEQRKERKRQKRILKEAEQKAMEDASSSKAQKKKRRKE